MDTALTKIEPIPLPDLRRTAMPSLPGWLASRVDALAETVQLVGETFQNVLTLPSALMPSEPQRAEMRRHIDGLTSLLRLTPETCENSEEATVVIVTKLLLVLPGQKASEDAAEAKGEAYLAALDDVPYWAVDAAVRNWHRGECGVDNRGKPYDYRWAPAPADVRRIALVEAHRLRSRIVMLERVLNAKECLDCTAEIDRGRKAMRGFSSVLADGGDLSSLTFEKAIEIGSAHQAQELAVAAE